MRGWKGDESIVEVVFSAEDVVGCACDPAVSLAFACERFGWVGGAGTSAEGGDVVDADGEEGAEACWERGEGEEGVKSGWEGGEDGDVVDCVQLLGRVIIDGCSRHSPKLHQSSTGAWPTRRIRFRSRAAL